LVCTWYRRIKQSRNNKPEQQPSSLRARPRWSRWRHLASCSLRADGSLSHPPVPPPPTPVSSGVSSEPRTRPHPHEGALHSCPSFSARNQALKRVAWQYHKFMYPKRYTSMGRRICFDGVIQPFERNLRQRVHLNCTGMLHNLSAVKLEIGPAHNHDGVVRLSKNPNQTKETKLKSGSNTLWRLERRKKSTRT
jgi:hypothetical protein